MILPTLKKETLDWAVSESINDLSLCTLWNVEFELNIGNSE